MAWKCLKHDTVAQKSVDETIRLDRAFHRWCRRRNEKGSWFSGAHNDKMFGMGYMNIPKSREGYTLADYERDFTLDRWLNDDVEKSKRLKPGELIESAGAKDIGFASQSFQKDSSSLSLLSSKLRTQILRLRSFPSLMVTTRIS